MGNPVKLLATKLHRPVPPPRWVQRPDLIQRLNEGLQSGCQVTLVSAPAANRPQPTDYKIERNER